MEVNPDNCALGTVREHLYPHHLASYSFGYGLVLTPKTHEHVYLQILPSDRLETLQYLIVVKNAAGA